MSYGLGAEAFGYNGNNDNIGTITEAASLLGNNIIKSVEKNQEAKRNAEKQKYIMGIGVVVLFLVAFVVMSLNKK